MNGSWIQGLDLLRKLANSPSPESIDAAPMIPLYRKECSTDTTVGTNHNDAF